MSDWKIYIKKRERKALHFCDCSSSFFNCLLSSSSMEIATMVGGAVLGPLFQSILDALKSSDLLTYARQSKLLDELNKWETMLKTIYVVLDSAEEQQMTNLRVKSWFNDLRDLAYDVDDILDDFNTTAMRRKFRTESEASTSKVRKLIPSFVAGLGLSTVKFNAGIVSKMNEISRRLEDIIRRKDVLNLSEGQVRQERPTLSTTSLVNEAQVYGREKDLKAILQLMKVEAGDGGISVIPIVGMGGVGKTTLAQLVYNDVSLQFDFKAWVSVGEDFDVPTITKTILQSASDEAKDLNSLQLKLREKLSRKKFLVILDDLWNEDYNKWTLFYSPVAAGAPGSRIIITTRNHKVSSMTGTVDGYPLQGLSYDDSISIFAYHALGRKDFSEHLHLKEVGEEIVRKCDGLPLAAKAVGGLLRGTPDRYAWEQLLKNKLWEEKSDIIPALRLSYCHLPSHLKRCFGYCAIFPKEYEFRKDDVVPLWLAEGFLQQLSQGYEYFDELFARSLFQRSVNDDSIFVMHDLINDLARSVSGGVCFNLDEEMSSRKSYGEVRHSAFNRDVFEIARRFENFKEMKSLRTFLALPISKWKDWEVFYLSSKVLDVLVPELKCLRVLSLSGYGIDELPKSVSAWKHLRYLNLHGALIETLPESLCELFNLQILILSKCRILRKLPKDLCNLINLQCLDIRDTDSLQEMPLLIGNLAKLHTLSKFIVGNIDGCMITELLKIPNLQGKLQIVGLQNVKDIQDAVCVKMRAKKRVDELVLGWTDNFDDFRDERVELQVLIALQPQENIAKLSIESYGGTIFPSWLGNHSFYHMTFLELCNCRNIKTLPPLGQLPSLKDLSIENMHGVKEVGMELYGEVSSSCANAFPSLETLKFENMVNWTYWSCHNIDEDKGQVFHKLQKLELRSCPRLARTLPKHLPTLQQLCINSCALLEAVPEMLASLGKLEVHNCKEVVFTSMPNLESLTTLNISNISGLASFDGTFLEALVSLEEIEVCFCDELKHLWKDEINIKRLGCLKRLKIMNCKELVSLLEGEEGIFPPDLRVLVVWNCEKLEKLPNQLHSLTSLTHLEVIGCPKLVTFPKGGLPGSVKLVEIRGCDSLVSLPEGIVVDENGNSYNGQTSHIEQLSISNCDALMVSSNGVFPASLQCLWICNGLKAQLFGSLQLQNRLSHLTSLEISNCSELVSFPDTGLPIPTLSSFGLWRCRKLRSLPNQMHNLTSLQVLHLHSCPEVVSIPEGGLPPNLINLQISYCNNLERHPLSEWRLNTFNLEELHISGDMEMVSSFPDDSLLLPTSLTELWITGFQNLKTISSGIHRLTSLHCLMISSCPKLRSLPREGFPPSLGRLSFYNCPLMKQRCRKGKGDYWPLIAPVAFFDC